MRDPTNQQANGQPSGSPALRRKQEWRSFVFLTVVMAPVLAVMLVGGYGMLVWVLQMLSGPPTQ